MDFLDLREPVSACSHGAGLLLALPGTLILWRRSHGDRAKRLSLLVFGFSLALCYAASAAFHGVHVAGDQLLVFQVMDHIGIFILIAGTYTPIAWNLLRGRWRRTTLVLVWLSATAGAFLHLACGTIPAWLSTSLYLCMGWGAIFLYWEIAKTITHRPLQPILVGGTLYSIGALLNLLEWPVLWPGVFQSHELFHLFVMGGSLCHFWFMLKVVLPAPAVPASPWPAPFSARGLREPARRPHRLLTFAGAKLASRRL
jgi:hemolysin III